VSRRGADLLISAGRVRVDGRRAKLGEEISSGCAVTVDGRKVQPARDHLTIVLNKPAGVITTLHDDRARKTVAALLPPGRRLFPVGRLDAATTGLLICTNDGELANFLSSPRNALARTYRITVRGDLSEQSIDSLGARQISKLPGGLTAFSMTLREGRNRQVRRMCARRGLRVTGLCRTHFGPVSLGTLASGSWRPMSAQESKALEQARSHSG